MNKLIEYKHEIRLDIYNVVLYVNFTNDLLKTRNSYKSTHNYVTTLTKEDVYGCRNMFTYYSEQPHTFWLTLELNPDLNSIAHEVFHATHRILSSHQIYFEIDNHEAYAYLNGYLVDKVFKLSELK